MITSVARRSLPMCAFLVSSAVAACTLPGEVKGDGAGEGPVVTDVGPREGDYGTTVTVKGERLEGAQVLMRTPDGEELQIPLEDGASAASPDAPRTAAPAPAGPLTFRVPFPAEGEMTLSAGGKTVSLGSFVPKTAPGRPAPFPLGSRLHGAAVLGDATVALVEAEGRVGFFVFGPDEPRFVPVEPALSKVDSVALHRDPARVEAVVRVDDDVLRLAFDGSTATATKYDRPDGSVLGAGVDARGIVVVVRTDEGIVRMRGEAPALTADGPAVPVPERAAKYQGTAVSGDGTVVTAWSGSGGTILDETASFTMQGLTTTDEEWGPAVRLGSLDDKATSLSATESRGLVEVSYCALDTGFFEGTETECSSARTLDGKTKLSLPMAQVSGLMIEPGRVGYASCGADAYVMVGVVDAPPAEQKRALYPCGRISSTIASIDAARIVVERKGKLWAPRPR